MIVAPASPCEHATTDTTETMILERSEPQCLPFRPACSSSGIDKQQQQQTLDPRYYPCLQSSQEHHLRRRRSSVVDESESHDSFSGGCIRSYERTTATTAARRSSLKSYDSSSSLRSIGSKCSSVKSNVSFSTVEIRSYEVILGDNPSCSSGPPLSLGWRYEPEQTVCAPVDEYEDERREGPRRRASWDGSAGSSSEEALALPREYREAVALWAGYSDRDIAQSIRTCLKVKKQRRRSLQTQKIEELADKVGRKILRPGRSRSRRRSVAEEGSADRFWAMYNQTNASSDEPLCR